MCHSCEALQPSSSRYDRVQFARRRQCRRSAPGSVEPARHVTVGPSFLPLAMSLVTSKIFTWRSASSFMYFWTISAFCFSWGVCTVRASAPARPGTPCRRSSSGC